MVRYREIYDFSANQGGDPWMGSKIEDFSSPRENQQEPEKAAKKREKAGIFPEITDFTKSPKMARTITT